MPDHSPRLSRLLDKKSLQAELGVGERQIDALIRRGLPFIPPEGGRGRGKTILFVAESVESWLLSQQAREESAPPPACIRRVRSQP